MYKVNSKTSHYFENTFNIQIDLPHFPLFYHFLFHHTLNERLFIPDTSIANIDIVFEGDENKKLLLDLEAIDPLLNLISGEDRTVRRHAIMALGVLCAHCK